MTPKYDIFLSYAGPDEEAVKHLARNLHAEGISLFLATWHLVPGVPWQEVLEEALDASRTCAVLLGRELGPWQNREMRAALQMQVEEPGFRLIPVLLPGGPSPGSEKLPRFLQGLSWVDFRKGLDDPDAFYRLLCGIRGTPLEEGETEGSSAAVPASRTMVPRPDRFVRRQEYLQVVEALLGAAKSTAAVALRGAGGSGKTALAQAVCWNEQVQRAYPNGILWVQMKEDLDEPDRLARVLDVIRAWTGKEPPAFETIDGASAHLRRLLDELSDKEKPVLLVVDDAWTPEDVTPFQGLRAVLLITTRDNRTLPAGTVSFEVETMQPSEAVELLGASLPTGFEENLSALSKRLGNWPLLLTLVNRQIRMFLDRDDLSIETALCEVEEALNEEGLTAFDQSDSEARHTAVGRTLNVSFRRLSEEDRTRCEELTIFPADIGIPIAILQKLWGLKPFVVKKLCSLLQSLSLILRFDRELGTIRLHDVIRGWLLKRRRDDLPSIHQKLLEASQPLSGRWADLPREETYLWRYLAHHLTGAGGTNVVREALFNLGYLQGKLEVTDIGALLADFSYLAPEDQEAYILRDALRLSVHLLSPNPQGLPGQLLGRLLNRENPSIRALIQQARSVCLLQPRTESLPRPGGPLVQTLEGHTHPVNAAAISKGRVVSASDAGTLRIWDLESGQTVHVLKEGLNSWINFETGFSYRGDVLAVCVLPDHRIVSAGDDGKLRIWNPDTGELIKILGGHRFVALAVSALADGRLVSGSADGVLHVWDSDSGEILKTFKEKSFGGLLSILALEPSRVIVGYWNGALRVWSFESGDVLQTLEAHEGAVPALSRAGEGRVVSASYDGTLRIWDLESGQAIRVLQGHQGRVLAVAQLDDQRLVSAADDRTLRVWDIDSGQTLQILQGHRQGVNAVSVLGHGRVVSGSADGTLRIWDLLSRQLSPSLQMHQGAVTTMASFEDGRVVSASSDGTIKLWNPESREIFQAFEGHEAAVTAVVVVDDNRLASTSADRTLRIWDVSSGRTIQTLRHWDGVRAVAILDGDRLVSAAWTESIRVWDMSSGQILRTLDVNGKGLWVLGEGRVALLTTDGELQVWDLTSEQRIQGREKIDSVLAILGNRFAVSPWADALEIWDLETRKPVQVLWRSEAEIAVLHFGGTLLVTASYDRALRVWDLRSGRVVQVFSLESRPLAMIRVPNSGTLLVGDELGQVHTFDVSDEVWTDLLSESEEVAS